MSPAPTLGCRTRPMSVHLARDAAGRCWWCDAPSGTRWWELPPRRGPGRAAAVAAARGPVVLKATGAPARLGAELGKGSRLRGDPTPLRHLEASCSVKHALWNCPGAPSSETCSSRSSPTSIGFLHQTHVGRGGGGALGSGEAGLSSRTTTIRRQGVGRGHTADVEKRMALPVRREQGGLDAVALLRTPVAHRDPRTEQP